MNKFRRPGGVGGRGPESSIAQISEINSPFYTRTREALAWGEPWPMAGERRKEIYLTNGFTMQEISCIL